MLDWLNDGCFVKCDLREQGSRFPGGNLSYSLKSRGSSAFHCRSLGIWLVTPLTRATPEQVLTQCLHLGGRCIADGCQMQSLQAMHILVCDSLNCRWLLCVSSGASHCLRAACSHPAQSCNCVLPSAPGCGISGNQPAKAVECGLGLLVP